jgi:lysophospholipase L1-like esterase
MRQEFERFGRGWWHLAMLAVLVAVITLLPLARAFQEEVWEQDIREFELQDRVKSPPENPILFVGASMIVRWNLKKFFPDLPAINRGFGGSEMVDVLHYADRIVIPYRPRIVVLYEGDNDTARGTSPEQVAKNFELLADKIHKALPRTKIIDISVKPSLARWSIVTKQHATNALLKNYCEQHGDYLRFLDVSQLTLGADGAPQRELYAGDGLHFNDEGYKLWVAAIRPLLK